MGLRQALRGRKVGFDTNIFIYMLEGNSEYKTQVNAILAGLRKNEFSIFASDLVFAEILPKLVKENDRQKIQTAVDFLCESDVFTLVPAGRDVCIRAGFLRGSTGMKTPDAIHIATAEARDCDIFLTNDKGIKTPEGMQRVLISEM